MRNVYLLGDSIFDNGAYVDGGPHVAAHLRERLSPGDQVKLLAVDGSVTAEVNGQLRNIEEECTHIVVSSGGNDALALQSLLYDTESNGPELLLHLSIAVTQFRAEYERLAAAIRKCERPVAFCTVYEGNLEDPVSQLVPAAISVFNDAIYRVANAFGIPVIELRDVCTESDDYANRIEPSVSGGAKIASAIAEWLGRS